MVRHGDLLLVCSTTQKSVLYLEDWRILRPTLTMIVHPRRADIGVTQPLLNLGDVGTGIERAKCQLRSQQLVVARVRVLYHTL